MYLFWLLSLLMANGMQHHTALIQYQHIQHVAHVKHVEHVDYLVFLTKLENSTPKTAAPTVQPIAAPKTSPVQVAPVSAPAGDYSCSALESLWVSAGGNPASEFIAAQIATAESGGNPRAISPTSDYGLWQINSSNAPGYEMLNPYANVREAIALSGNGTNWSPWTTFTSGIYASQC
jgi:hypothetical protein